MLDSLNVPTSALMGLAGAAVAVSVMGGTPGQAMAATAPIGSGSSGQEVQAIQKALGIKVDGKYGKTTQAAVTDFQIRQGLKEIDGVVGKETAKALGLDEQYRPMGYVVTNSGIGLNVREGPGLGYFVVGGAPDGAFLEQDYETVVYNDGYAWTPLYGGGWVAADYTVEGGYSPVAYYGDEGCGRPVAYYDGCGGYGDVGYYQDDYYGDDYYGDNYYEGYSPTAYRPVAYRPVGYYGGDYYGGGYYGGGYYPVGYGGGYYGGYYPVAYGGGGCGCNGYN